VRYFRQVVEAHAARALVLVELTIRARQSHKQCDTRCVEAVGEECVCSCGGENHGSGAWPAGAVLVSNTTSSSL